MDKILLVEDDENLREALVDTLLLANYECIEADSAEVGIALIKQHKFDLIISDIQMEGIGGMGLLSYINSNQINIPLLLITAFATIDNAVKAIKLGACDYISKPFAPEVLLNQVLRYIKPKFDSSNPIACDKKSIAIFDLARKVAKSDASVMILGPSGSGKEVMAKFIHLNSNRSDKSFVAINCAAIPENMLEATLFGYEKGAFTGAIQACPGKFEQAQDGTLLLDEISEMELGLQAKLLRVLQEHEVEPLGGRRMIKLNVRVLATSNRDLKEMIKEGKFREDLFYRINVFPIEWPALKERKDDIIPLSNYFLSKYTQSVPKFTEDAANLLLKHTWPGNVRELDNVIQRSIILQVGDSIDVSDIIIDDLQYSNDNLDLDLKMDDLDNSSDDLSDELRKKEHAKILEALIKYEGKRKVIAEKLGISDRTLRYKLAKMRELGIKLPY